MELDTMNKAICAWSALCSPRSTVAFLGASALLCAIPSMAQAVSTPPSTQSTYSSPKATPLLLNGGDLIDVQVFSTPELSGHLRVDQNGLITLPVGGEIDVRGLTAKQLGRAIEKRLKSAQLMQDPHVSVLVSEYVTQKVTVLGQVKKPGPFPFFGNQSLYDVLSAAGGVSQDAGSTITISHRNDSEPPEIIQVHSPNFSAVQHNTQIAPGDTIVVSQADPVYVVGSVGRQGSFPILNGVPLTVLNVLALASGLSPTAAGSKASIVRQTPNGEVTTIPLNLDRILNRKAPNITLEAADILVVPSSSRKTFVQLALPSLTNSVTSAAVSAAVIHY